MKTDLTRVWEERPPHWMDLERLSLWTEGTELKDAWRLHFKLDDKTLVDIIITTRCGKELSAALAALDWEPE